MNGESAGGRKRGTLGKLELVRGRTDSVRRDNGNIG
jgi:hypothetical protein